MQRGRWSDAEKTLQQGMEKAESYGNNELLGMICSNIGIYFSIQNKYQAALSSYMDGLHYFEDAGNMEGVTQAYHNLGMTHEQMNQLDQAESYYQRSLDVSRELGFNDMIAKTTLNRSHVKVLKGDYRIASAFIEQVFLALKGLNNPHMTADAYLTKGQIEEKTGNPRKAQTMYATSYRISSRCDNLIGSANSAFEYGRLMLIRKRTIRGNKFLEIAFEIFKKLNDKDGQLKVQNLINIE